MPASPVRIPAPTLRGEIENVLQTEAHGLRAAVTVRWLASHLGAPVRAVSAELEKMRLEGQIITRVTRGGDVLWKWKDLLQSQWDKFAGPGTFAGRR